ncbi:S-layer homology domain-containing protein [Flavonifractor sp. An10]|uniref:S-layer homology domain-containing protein n=1 Tax=Flavonifractor sp. An10 TaxID=1965537 RepID=UPI0013A64B07|nr:S-layer homology domain-containing protein [Flavonifractor sp. An10]
MRNLKRTLSLVLAVVMVIGLMVVGASAVSYNDFSDREEIVNKDAVSMLTTLGIIEGQPDGSYNPTGDVDRAQMAKMISVALTNNEDCDTLYTNVNSGLTDITANWARGYINYCYVRGIIAGRGDNTFDPDANVTGVEAAKMLLAALGYNADIEGLVGPDWALNTAALAQQLGIFRNFTKDVSEPLSRDDAALLIYNALDVEMIQQYQTGYALVYADHRTILSSVFGVVRVEGVVTANEWARLEETDSDAALRTGKTTLDEVVVYDSTTSNTTVPEGIREDDPVTFNVSTPVDMIGKAVTMYVEKTTILANSNVIGIATNDEANVIHATAATEETLDDLLDGTGIETDRNTQYYVNYGWCEDGATEAVELINQYPDAQLEDKDPGYYSLNGVEVEVIDNNDDGTAEYVLYLQETLSEVTRYSDRNETISFYIPELNNSGAPTGDSDTVTRDFEDVVFNDDVAADDLILYVEYGGRTYIQLAPIVTDTMNRVDRDRDSELYITLDNGEEYRQAYLPDAASMTDVELTHFDIDNARADIGFDDAYDFILDATEQYVIAVRPAEEQVTNYALVLGSAWTQNALTRSGEVKILMADGTENTFDIDWNESRKVFENETTNTRKDTALENYLGTRDVQHSGSYRTGAAVGTVIEYSLNDAGDELTIENILNLNTLADGGYVNQNNGDPLVDVVSNPIAYIAANRAASDTSVRTANNLQYTIQTGQPYSTGDGTLYLTVKNTDAVADARNDNASFAIDRDTIAFYYVDSDTYGVATGYSNMSDIPVQDEDGNPVSVQVYPVLEKNNQGGWTASRLADVALFNSEPSNDSNDYMLVLNANYYRGDELWLNVVFEDGTAATIEIDDDGGHNFDRTSSYMKAYAYVENADGTYDISDRDPIGEYDAHRTDNGTIYWAAPTSVSPNPYLTLLDSSNVWDVTDVDSANDDITAGTFTRTDKNAVIVTGGSRDETIRAAWIWDIDDTTVDFDTSDYLVVLSDADNCAYIYYNDDLYDSPDFPDLDLCMSLIEAEMEDQGYTIVDRTRNGNTYTWEVEDSRGFDDTYRFVYDATVSFTGNWLIPSYVGRVNGVETFVPTASATITNRTDSSTHLAGSTPLAGTHVWGRLDANNNYDWIAVGSVTVTGSGFDIEDGYTAVDVAGLALSITTDGDLDVAVTVNGDDLEDCDTYDAANDVVYVEGNDNEIVATVTGSFEITTASDTKYIAGTNTNGLVRDVAGYDASRNNATVTTPTGSGQIVFTASADGATTFEDVEVTFTWTVDQQTTTVDLNLATDLT